MDTIRKQEWISKGLFSDQRLLSYWLTAFVGFLFMLPIGIFLIDPAATQFSRQLPSGLKAVAKWLTDFGKSEWELIPAGVGILSILLWRKQSIFPRPLSRRHEIMLSHLSHLFLFIFVSVAGSGLVAQLLKHIVGRARPRYFETLGSTGFDPFAFKHSFASMPSGHATTLFAVATIISFLAPRYAKAAFIAALMLASTRVFVGAHYVMDVVAGALLGTGFTILMRGLFAYFGNLFQKQSGERFTLRGTLLFKEAWRSLIRFFAYSRDFLKTRLPL